MKRKGTKEIKEKKHRLWPELYRGEQIVAFTGTVKNRNPLFSNKIAFQNIECLLLKELELKECDAYVYLFMPDHFHFILTGRNSSPDIKKCIDGFKQKSGYWLSQYLPQFKWQKDYFDHILRNGEDLEAQIRYILNNPVREGIVDSWKKYNLHGSTIYDLDEWK